VFKKHKSIFAPRYKESDAKSYYNTEKVLKNSFNLDWDRLACKSGLVKSVGGEEVFVQLKPVMALHYLMLKSVFDECSCSDEKSPWFMSLNQFTGFIVDCEFIDNNSQFCRQADVDTLFIVANLKDGDKASLANKLNPERALALFDFMDILIRISLAKYTKDSPFLPPPEALETFLSNHVLPAADKNQVNMQTDRFRRDRLYFEEVETVFKENRNTLAILFNYFKSLTRSKRLPVAQFLDMLVKCQLLGDDLAMPTREAVTCFVKARMVVIDQFQHKDKHETLSFIDFLECLGRVADCLSPASYEDLEDAGLEELTAFEVHQQQISGLISLNSRASCGINSPKTRPLDEKISALLNIIVGMLSEFYDVEDEVHLRKKLKAETKFDEGNAKY